MTENSDLPSNTEKPRKKISVALQGGGAHGAFAWGVMDRLLQEPEIEVIGACGTSAGGMNAACITQGMIKGGNENARDTLHRYWKQVNTLAKKTSPYIKRNPFDEFPSDSPLLMQMKSMSAIWGKFFPFLPNPFQQENEYNLHKTPGFQLMDTLTSIFSPYELNPSGKNLFGEMLSEFFDFEAVRNNDKYKLFLATTHVKTGKIKIFDNKKFSSEVLQASACLPSIFQAVKVDDEHYWDGGYIANPAIYPLIENCPTKDIVIIQLTRSVCDKVPTTRHEIADRLKEITYNNCLVREMRAIYFISKLIDEGKTVPGALNRMNIHLIKNEDTFKNLNLSSALNTDWDFLQMLFHEGRKTADKWLLRNFDKIGTSQSTLDPEIFHDFV